MPATQYAIPAPTTGPIAEVRLVPHEYERGFEVLRLFVNGVEVSPRMLASRSGTAWLAAAINRAAKGAGR